MNEKPSDSPATLCITPLYHFSSDAAELEIAKGSRISQFPQSLATLTLDEPVSTTFKFCPPDYLLFQDSSLPAEYFLIDISSSSGRERAAQLVEGCLASTRELLRVVRLFSPGRLSAGETFIMRAVNGTQSWRSVASGRASDMTVDYFLLRLPAKTYFLNSPDISSLRAFRETLLPVLRRLASFPSMDFALILYGSDDGERVDLIGAITALEALLTKKDEVEGLTYRLSMRIASLLGSNAEDRKVKFLEMKKFYNLRSRLVHGSPLGTPLLNQLGELHSLRETLRRVMLSVMALYSEGVRPDDLPNLLDELAFDEEKRKQIQETASKFLHITTGNQRN